LNFVALWCFDRYKIDYSRHVLMTYPRYLCDLCDSDHR